jgi:hypothetical protein
VAVARMMDRRAFLGVVAAGTAGALLPTWIMCPARAEPILPRSPLYATGRSVAATSTSGQATEAALWALSKGARCRPWVRRTVPGAGLRQKSRMLRIRSSCGRDTPRIPPPGHPLRAPPRSHASHPTGRLPGRRCPATEAEFESVTIDVEGGDLSVTYPPRPQKADGEETGAGPPDGSAPVPARAPRSKFRLGLAASESRSSAAGAPPSVESPVVAPRS